MERLPDWVDEIGYWSELKIDIIRKYAAAYSRLMAAQRVPFYHIYVDAFAGGGLHVSRSTGRPVAGSPMEVLRVRPPFREYHFVDLRSVKTAHLRSLVGERPDVFIHEGDCNEVLLREILPRCRYEDYRRALWVLDPYGMHYRWQVVQAAGEAQTVDLLLNFPIMDMNRDVLRRDLARTAASGLERMLAFWGDDSWREVLYQTQASLFGPEYVRKVSQGNRRIVEAYCQRLKAGAGFRHVARPLPMRNTIGAEVYFLVFASANATAARIVNDIFRGYSSEGLPSE